MTTQESNFSDFITDKDGDYSHAQFLSLAKDLLDQGRRPGRVFLAMYRAARVAALEHSVGEYYALMKLMHDDINDFMPQLEEKLDEMISAKKQ